MMIGIDLEKFPEFSSCLQFVENLASEQSVLAFPGSCFDFPGYFRFVLTVPEAKIIEACQRIQEFCYGHFEEIKTDFVDSNKWEMNDLEKNILAVKRVSRVV